MRIVIEIEGTPQQPQVTVTSPSASQQVPATGQASIGDATNAGQAPSVEGTATTGVNVNAGVTAPIVAQPSDDSAGAAPNVSET